MAFARLSPLHLVLLGDSIFDNAVYVPHGKSVSIHLNEKILATLPLSSSATLLAKDGDIVDGVQRQLQKMPQNATHIFVSVGGNDALRAQYLLLQPTKTVAEALSIMAKEQDEFKVRYTAMLEQLLAFKLPLTLCLIYNPNYDKEEEQRVASLGLNMYNAVILSLAVKHKLPIIDLKTMFDSKKDYANPIEPSEQGGDKITNAILNVVKHHNFEEPSTQIYV
eukprot:TRINITY_DN1257_c0_g1_i1.p1 TRINITY_DN1257_c0_g1~~TRINITY_DN1257_c0_g1_i1.p1  ORF type:complete len:222 (+),score=42.76 TRINITY_DN1257_c0_g1_i1:192-857(+)